jgi:hypothetical protein
MNERIKQLANIWANRRAEDEKLGIVYTFSEPALEQFAELIVKETMQVVANQLPSNQYLDVADAVIKHFGVKE